jgi:chromosome segregation ATPase
MSEQEADKQASDAIVAGVAFYAAALARADVERARLNKTIAERDKTIIAMIDESNFDAKKTNDIRIDHEKYQQEAHDAKCEVGTLKTKLESTEQALKTEQAKCRRLESDYEVQSRWCDQLCEMARKTGRPALMTTEALKVAKDAIDEYIVNHPPTINKRASSEF